MLGATQDVELEVNEMCVCMRACLRVCVYTQLHKFSKNLGPFQKFEVPGG